MSKRVHPALVVLVLLVVVVVVAMLYARRTETPTPIASTGAGMAAMRGGRRGGGGRGGMGGGGGAPETAGGRQDTTLGLKFSRSMEPQGFKVDKFEGAPSPSPLKIMGVKEGDVITSIKGQKQQIRNGIIDAIKELQDKGTPIEMTVSRAGKAETIKWTQKLPAESVVRKEQTGGGGGREGGGGRGGRRGR